ncbi:baseplate J/gp47 family protein [Embleya hyalina]|uniref:Putative baseplate assembly protein n=1 Tax=Embleya hyalina TaxID=516124 RepID=A0A401Z4N7_9ACTN|nr:baseplate J/gp47 family protein [Embleya hyalina]GCE01786.1 putative baseplate assembly protein [Embleya hyalina]
MSSPPSPSVTRAREGLLADAVAAVRARLPRDLGGTWTGADRREPGLAVLETFVDMAELLRDRVDRAPELHRLRVLGLLGIRSRPASAATAGLVFELAADLGPVTIPAGTQVATRPAGEDTAVFTTLADVAHTPCAAVATGFFLGREVNGTFAGAFHPFPGSPPVALGPDDPGVEAYPLVVLSQTTPGARVVLDVDADEPGAGFGPGRWQTWQGRHWVDCRHVSDAGDAMGRPGTVVVDVPADQYPAAVRLRLPDMDLNLDLDRTQVGLLRFRSDRPDTLGGGFVRRLRPRADMYPTTGAAQARWVADGTLGTAAGIDDECLRFAHPPLLTAGVLTALVVLGDRTEQWIHVDSLAGSGPEDRHFSVLPGTDEAVFAAVARTDSGPRRHGARLPRGAVVRVPHHLTGGGTCGNVAARTITTLPRPVPGVSTVTNPLPAVGGIDAETPNACAVREPLGRTFPRRAVTPGEYEQTALDAGAGMARVHYAPGAAGILDPAHAYAVWRPATTTIVFTRRRGTSGAVPKGTRVSTAGGIVFETTQDSSGHAATTATTVTPLLLNRGAANTGDLFTAGQPTSTLTAAHDLAGIQEPMGLILATVSVPQHPDTDALSLCVTVTDASTPARRVAVSVYRPEAGRLWWDIDRCAYVAAVPDANGAIRVPLDARARHTLDWDGPNPPPTLAVQVLDPGRTAQTGYVVAWDTGDTDPVPAVQTSPGARDRRFTSDGRPGQVFPLLDARVCDDPRPRILVDGKPWNAVPDFADSGEGDEHVVVDHTTGQVIFGPWSPGTTEAGRQHGKVPPAGAVVTVDAYRTTRGAAGNVGPGEIDRLTQPAPPDVVGARNPEPATGGADGATGAGVVRRGVRLLLIPAATPDPTGRIPHPSLSPSPEARDRLRLFLEARQAPGVPLWLEPPRYLGIVVEADLVPQPWTTVSERDRLAEDAAHALYAHFNPVNGGPDHTGWPLGRTVHAGDAFRLLEALPAVRHVAAVRLYPCDPITGARRTDLPMQSLACDDDETVFSFEHRMTVLDP